MSTVELDYTIAEPPPARLQRDSILGQIRDVLDAHPGESIRFSPCARKVAEGRATNLRRQGYEVTTRVEDGGTVLYAKKLT